MKGFSLMASEQRLSPDRAGGGQESLMKTDSMNRITYTLVAIALVSTVILACDKSTGPAPPDMIAGQIAGCQSHLPKVGSADSCFSYEFHEALIVDFCAMANCCPDSNRFSFEHRIANDTIFVAVADTAAPLCNCFCRYVLHMEFRNLTGYSYIFFCTIEDSVTYAAWVHRNW